MNGGRNAHELYIYGLDQTTLFRGIIGFVERKGLRLSKVINQFERRGAQPGKARWRSKTPPSVAVKHSNGARPIGPLDGSGSRSKEKKPADGRLQARVRISPGLPTILVGYSDFVTHERQRVCSYSSMMPKEQGEVFVG